MAAVLSTIFVVIAVAGRAILQYFKTGSFGIRLADAKRQPIAAIAGAAFSLSFAISFVVIWMDFLSIWPLSESDLGIAKPGTFLVGLAGVGIVVIAQQQMGNAWRIGVDPSEATRLVTDGLYRRSRNPIYFGIFLYWIGISGTLAHPAIWALALVCWVSIEAIVRKVEEPYLLDLHGQDFEGYKSNTNRYLL